MVDFNRKFDVLGDRRRQWPRCVCRHSAARRRRRVGAGAGRRPEVVLSGWQHPAIRATCAAPTTAATDILTGPYSEQEFWDDLLRVTGGENRRKNSHGNMIAESKDILPLDCRNRACAGKPSAGRHAEPRPAPIRSSSVAGKGAMLNALLSHRRTNSVLKFSTTAEVLDLRIQDGHVSLRRRLKQGRWPRQRPAASTLVAAAGGFEANYRMVEGAIGATPPIIS